MIDILNHEAIKKRFMDKVMPEPNSGCWLWAGSSVKNGYGQVRVNYKLYLSHRISHELFKGEIPDGMNVLHTCDVRCCVNPDHLFLGTQKDNVQDMIAKGRRIHTKLNQFQVRTIKRLLSFGTLLNIEIAEIFKVSPSTISAIKHGRNWPLINIKEA